MIAMAMIAFFAAVMPAEEGVENFDAQEIEIALCDDSDLEELVMNDECEYTDQIAFEEETNSNEEESLLSEEEK